ncbi:ATP-binding cassette domain-containing protein [Cytobacillus praedii]|uniref:ATP-binding cassette domain-containing protein n=1 Tax=Cytobacillus praedii TaxID=1742358 RepID=UPI000708AAFC|nr:ATP-binding cassette domain-containing protein [Cytobacillus praedii]MED3551631.1 ATP-binding cassette domain-containing protein [Cytobacillus praedii]
MIIFEADKAGKKIDGVNILHDLSICISRGEKVAITGHNGSGKSSLLKLIGGIYENTSGQVRRGMGKTGYVPEHFPENIRFKMQEYLLLIGKMNGNSESELIKKIHKYAEIFAITNFLNTPLKKCSKGTKQKAGIIQALLIDPDILLLDEPLTGLDESTQVELLNELASINTGFTIIFTAHESLLIDGLANRVITVANGRIIADDKKEKKEKYKYIKVIVPNQTVASEIPNIRFHYIEERTVEITVLSEHSDEVLTRLLESGCSIVELIEKR